MNIVMVNQYAAPIGGIEVFLTHVMKQLHGQGHKLLFLHADGMSPSSMPWPCHQIPWLTQSSREGEQELHDRLVAFQPEAILVHSLLNPRAFDALRKYAPTSFYLHAHYPLACAGDGKYWQSSSQICSRRFGPGCLLAPWLHQCGSRNLWHHGRRYFAAATFRSQVQGCRSVFVASQYMVTTLQDEGFATLPIHKAPLAIADELLKAPREVAASSAGEKPRVLFPARLVEGKGGLILLQALHQVDAPVHLVIAGDGRQKAALEQAAKALPSRHQVTFTGWLSSDQLISHYTASSVVVMPSLFPEPFGYVGLEAMAHGRPVIAFDVGGVREWLVPDQTGVLCPRPLEMPSATHQLAAALEFMVKNPDRAAQMGARGWERVQKEFRLSQHCATLLKNL